VNRKEKRKESQTKRKGTKTTNKFTNFGSQTTKIIADIHYDCKNKHCPKDPILVSNALIQEKKREK
jgi:hypothetical protein